MQKNAVSLIFNTKKKQVTVYLYDYMNECLLCTIDYALIVYNKEG